ncbi:MAG: ABC transporter permease subunit [Propionibacteriaceae bacterium]|jgi:arabinogalactan oligomer/maltooligosaccharide transport system permease protein|nr:ABC transporter permease subunit [Propionibacteriaceae bacterium]
MTPTKTVGDGGQAPPRTRDTSTAGLIVKIIFLGAVLAIAVYAVPLLIHYKLWLWLVLILLAGGAIFFIYTTKRFIPGKYLFPGTLLLVLFLIVPIILTVRYSFTNLGDGSRGSKEDAIANIVTASVQQTAGSPLYNMAVAVENGDSVVDGPFILFLIERDDASQTVYYGGEGDELASYQGDVDKADGQVTAVDGYQLLTSLEINAIYTSLQEMTVKVGDNSGIKVNGPKAAFQGQATVTYDEANDQLVGIDGTIYPIGKVGNSDYFVGADGKPAFTQSWLQGVGGQNYTDLFNNSNIRSQFLGAFVWTFFFALLSVLLTFAVGFFLALTLNDDRIKGKKLWRSFLLLPYAVPGFISLLIWQNFWNRDFGMINNLFGLHVDWLGDPNLAKFAILFTQLWMGFPYMFIVCTGALQSIPGDVKEAAQIDGSTGLSTTFRITMPLLLISVAPLLVASFAFNFNNFNAIQLLTKGGPFLPGQYARGSTDILISMIYRQAFGGSGVNQGFASAMSVILFVLTGVIAAIQFRGTRKLEELA